MDSTQSRVWTRVDVLPLTPACVMQGQAAKHFEQSKSLSDVLVIAIYSHLKQFLVNGCLRIVY